VLCGAGEDFEEVKILAASDERISVLGQVPPSVARGWMQKAEILVNPRMNDCEYTKYSFPSKTLEYLMSGNKVVAYKLDGMKEEYRKFLIEPKSDTIQALKDAIVSKDKGEDFIPYAKENLAASKVCEKIIETAFVRN
jgi:glycosyltransferase involved in cell wall biosynthesis